jgi:hypothetical protein
MLGHVGLKLFPVEANQDGSIEVFDKKTGIRYTRQNHFVGGGDKGDECNFSASDADTSFSSNRVKVRIGRRAIQQIIETSLESIVLESLNEDWKTRGRKTVVMPITSRVTLTSGVARVDIHTEIAPLR